MVSDSPAALEMVLRRSELARTNNFDLIGDNGYEALRVELAADFPYLTLSDLNNIIKLGIKGKLDTYKARTLNFTRVYQWVEQRSVYCLGYWQRQYPGLLEWAHLTETTQALLAEIDTYETPAAAFASVHKFRALLQKVVRRQHYPQVGDDWNSLANANAYPQQAAQYYHVADELYPQFLQRYPEDAKQHTPIF